MDSYTAHLKSWLKSRSPQDMADIRAKNEALLNCKFLGPGAVHIDSALANLSVQYKNEDYIGTQLMPIIQVAKPSDKFFKYGKRDRLNVPDASVGARSVPNEVTETRTTDNYSCQPYALMDYLDDRTLRAQDAPLNEMVDIIASVNDALDLAEEIRIAAIVGVAASYPTANKVALSGADRWDSGSGGDPVGAIQTGIDALFMGAGQTEVVGFGGVEAVRALQRHPRIVDGMKYVYGGVQANLQQLAAFLGLDRIVVGKARKDTANIGQTEVDARIWPKAFGILRVAKAPGIRTVSFGYTFRFGEKITTQWYDQKPGVSGGYYGKVGEDEDHHIVASDAGYFIDTCVS